MIGELRRNTKVGRALAVAAALGVLSAAAVAAADDGAAERAEFRRLFLGEGVDAPAEVGARTAGTMLHGTAPERAGTSWWAGFGAPPAGQGLGSSVNAAVVYGGSLVVGGDFRAAGTTAANRIAAWNGTTWSRLRSGLDDRVFALTTFNGQLIAAGDFQHADGVPASNVAAWDGSAWTPLGYGPGGPVYALTVFNGQLIAGGEFPGHVRYWDGSAWQVVGFGLNKTVTTLSSYTGYLVAGGLFTSVLNSTSTSVSRVAKWNGTAWSVMGQVLGGGGVNSWVSSTVVRNDSLFVGGAFRYANFGTVTVPHLALWVPSGSSGSWKAVGGGTSHTVLSLGDFSGSLVVGGEFTSVGTGVSANHVAAWNGTSWGAFGLGLGGTLYQPLVRALPVYNSELYAAGAFRMAGGSSSEYIARWTAPPPVAGPPQGTAAPEIAAGEGALRLLAAPNPFRAATRVSFTLAAPGAGALSVFDVCGRRVATLADGGLAKGAHSYAWHGTDAAGNAVPAGVYFVRFQGDAGTRTRSVTLTR